MRFGCCILLLAGLLWLIPPVFAESQLDEMKKNFQMGARSQAQSNAVGSLRSIMNGLWKYYDAHGRYPDRLGDPAFTPELVKRNWEAKPIEGIYTYSYQVTKDGQGYILTAIPSDPEAKAFRQTERSDEACSADLTHCQPLWDAF